MASNSGVIPYRYDSPVADLNNRPAPSQYDSIQNVPFNSQPSPYTLDAPPTYSPCSPAPSTSTASTGLRHPVVIPQRRPGSKERGFVTAYAPCLSEYDIDEATFLGFVESCNRAVKGSPVLSAVQVVAFGVGMTPDLTVMAVTTAVQIGAGMANSMFAKHQTNSFLDQYNETLFKPRGLFCMIMMYDPVANADMERHPSVATQPNSGEISGWKQHLNKRDPFYTDPEAAARLPFVVAPLVYHNTEAENDAGSEEGKPASGGSKVKNAFSRFEKYLDRRAQAQYTAENQGDLLSTIAPVHKGFTNRYLDPNHPAVNNGLLGLLSGGYITEDPEKRKRKRQERIAEEADRLQTEHERHVSDLHRNNYSPRELQRQLEKADARFQEQMAGIRRKMDEAEYGKRNIKKNVLYLTIVNLPSNGDVAAARRELTRVGGAEVNAVQV